MNSNSRTPSALALRLAIYFGCVIGLFVAIATFAPWAPFLPVGGHDLDLPGTAQSVFESLGEEGSGLLTTESRLTVALVLITRLAGTVILMIPITWVYMATKFV